jgi:hypothetical protein
MPQKQPPAKTAIWLPLLAGTSTAGSGKTFCAAGSSTAAARKEARRLNTFLLNMLRTFRLDCSAH